MGRLYDRVAWALFRPIVTRHPPSRDWERALLQARYPDQPHMYKAKALLAAAFAALSSLALLATTAILAIETEVLPLLLADELGFLGGPGIALSGMLPWIPVAVALPLAAYGLFHLAPIARARERAGRIDQVLPYAANFAAAMGDVNAAPQAIFSALADEPAFGGVSEEARWIVRDMRLFGKDVLTALDDAQRRSPSVPFRDFLDGIASTLTSGGLLKRYFAAKSRELMFEARTRQREDLDGLGVLAESYVTVAVAAPVFIIVMFSTMLFAGGGSGASRDILLLLILVALPLVHAAFAAVIQTGGESA
jgi:flagellar protein FlaJ